MLAPKKFDACRIEILDCHKLKPDHFSSWEEATKAADIMVEGLRANLPNLALEHPDIIIPGVPQLDQFWYFKHEGTMAALRCTEVFRNHNSSF